MEIQNNQNELNIPSIEEEDKLFKTSDLGGTSAPVSEELDFIYEPSNHNLKVENEDLNKNKDKNGEKIVVKDEGDEVKNKDGDESVEEDTNKKDLSPLALTLLALQKEQGLNIFENDDDVPAEVDAKGFVTKIHNYIEKEKEQVLKSELEKVGEYGKYINYLIQGGSKEDIEPAIIATKYSEFDLNSSDVTEADLKDLVFNMYIRKNVPENEAKFLINKLDQDELMDKAKESVEFHKQYKNYIEEKAVKSYNDRIAKEQEDRIKFEVSLKESFNDIKSDYGLSDNDFNKFQNIILNEDQIVNVYNPNTGNYDKVKVSKFDLELHKLTQDPKKILLLSILFENDFNLNFLKNKIKGKVNEDIYSAIENKFNTNSKNVSEDYMKKIEELYK